MEYTFSCFCQVLQFACGDHLRHDIADGCHLRRTALDRFSGSLCRKFIQISSIGTTTYNVDARIGHMLDLLDFPNRIGITFGKTVVDHGCHLIDALR